MSTPAVAVLPAAPQPGLWSQPYRALSIGSLMLIAQMAFEYIAVATAMPTVAAALDGLQLYALAFGAPLAAAMVGTVAAGRWSDQQGPNMPLWGGLALFVAGLLLAGLASGLDGAARARARAAGLGLRRVFRGVVRGGRAGLSERTASQGVRCIRWRLGVALHRRAFRCRFAGGAGGLVGWWAGAGCSCCRRCWPCLPRC